MRVVMLGTGPFAAPTFRAIIAAGHDVPLLVTQPIKDAQRPGPQPMRAVAAEQGIAVFDPVSLNTPEACAQLATFDAELLVTADYGQILGKDALGAARRGGVNLHGSLLPKYRGAAPINWAIYHGETETGVTVIEMTKTLDGGPALAKRAIAIGPDETAEELEPRLADLRDGLVVETIAQLEAGMAMPLVQNASLASKARRLRKTDGAVNWSRTAQQIHNQRRAFEPWPKTFTHWLAPGADPWRLILGRTSVVEAAGQHGVPGTVIETAGGKQLIVACGEGVLAIHQAQPAGKRMLDVAELLRGYRIEVGAPLGEAAGNVPEA